MDACLLVYRALGVPDVVEDAEHRREAAAWHLGRLCSLPLSNSDPARAYRHVDAMAAIIDVVVDHVATGQLDEVIANYGFVRELSFWADQVMLTGRVDANPDDVRHWSAVLLGCIVEFVSTHPFGPDPVPTNGRVQARGRRVAH